ncbi:MAG: SRPBCC domain-containing protein [Myxococcales bacterium]|nr:SRPBCC domain-containing protein [Myxococcales bacterium]
MAAQSDSRDIRIERVYDAPVSAVWEAWTDPALVAQWWGPRGFSLTTHSKDLRAGGTWRYTMHGPDGKDWPNITTYHVVEPYKKLVYDHGATEHTPPLFRVTVTFEEVDGKTKMVMISTFATPEAARETAKMIKRVGGTSTWDRLDEHLAQTRSGKERFVINRTFEAPIERVFEHWTDAALLAKWLAPAGATVRFVRSDIRVGASALFAMTSPHGITHVRSEYLAIERPRRVVYAQQFVDEHEKLAAAPGADVWPATLLVTVLLAEETADRTRVTVTCEPYGATSDAELRAFVHERTGMTLGWTGSFDALEEMVERG